MIRQASSFCFVAVLLAAPCAFAAGRTALPAPSADKVGVILDDLSDTTHAGQIGSAPLSSAASLSSAADSHLISLLSGGQRPSGPPRRARVPEPQALVAWAIDLIGLAGLVLYFRRRTPAPVTI